jgi:hypothetical protein
MKKYYLRAIDMKHSPAMHKLGLYYECKEINYDLMKKYFLMAIDKGYSPAMYNLGVHYQYVEKNYDLAKKYYLMAIEKGNTNSMCILGLHYFNNEQNYDMAEKYYLMAIEKGSYLAMKNLCFHYRLNYDNETNLHNFIFAIIKGNIKIKKIKLKEIISRENNFLFVRQSFESKIINIFCEIIDKLNIKDFKYCAFKIIAQLNKFWRYKQYYKNNVCHYFNNKYRLDNKNICLSDKLTKNNINYFMNYISKLYYSKNKKYKKCLGKLLKYKAYSSQLFMEYLDFYYYEYIKKEFAPNGSGYVKTKNHFYSIVNKQ